MELFHDIEFWVAVSFVLFVVLIYKYTPVPRIITGSLDSRAASIASELEKARALRAEAEQVLADYRRRQSEVEQEAADILAKTRHDAEEIARNAGIELQRALDKHSRAAMEKIAQAEAKAVKDVQNHMVDLAIAAARAIMRDYLAKGGSNELLKVAAAEIERKLH